MSMNAFLLRDINLYFDKLHWVLEKVCQRLTGPVTFYRLKKNGSLRIFPVRRLSQLYTF